MGDGIDPAPVMHRVREAQFAVEYALVLTHHPADDECSVCCALYEARSALSLALAEAPGLAVDG